MPLSLLKNQFKEQVHTNILMTDKYAHFQLKNMHIYLGKTKKSCGGIKWTEIVKLLKTHEAKKSSTMIKIKALVLENVQMLD